MLNCSSMAKRLTVSTRYEMILCWGPLLENKTKFDVEWELELFKKWWGLRLSVNYTSDNARGYTQRWCYLYLTENAKTLLNNLYDHSVTQFSVIKEFPDYNIPCLFFLLFFFFFVDAWHQSFYYFNIVMQVSNKNTIQKQVNTETNKYVIH